MAPLKCFLWQSVPLEHIMKYLQSMVLRTQWNWSIAGILLGRDVCPACRIYVESQCARGHIRSTWVFWSVCLPAVWTWDCPSIDLGRNGTWQSGFGNLHLRIMSQPGIPRVHTSFISIFLLLVVHLLKGNLGGCFLRPVLVLSHILTARTQWTWLLSI